MRILSIFALLCFPAVALAGEHRAHQTDYVAAYAGLFDVSQQDDDAVQLGLEYRYKSIYRGLRPLFGIAATTDEAVYGYGGLAWDVYLSDNIILTPNLAVGAFTQGSGKDLGHAIEFRDAIELNYQFEGGQRLGLHFNHMSNASIGDDNPGTEILMLMYHQPLNWQGKGSTARWWE